MRARALAVGALLVCGCPRTEEAPEQQFDPNDRALEKLKAEQERLAKAGAPKLKEPDADPLAAIATAPSKPETLGIPSGVAADLGDIAFQLIEVQQSQSVTGGKISLATADRFLKVTLEGVSSREVELDLSGATLENGDQTVGIARDVQRVAHGSPLITKFRPRSTERVVLYFEAPPEMIRKGLKIILTSAGSRVELPLQ